MKIRKSWGKGLAEFPRTGILSKVLPALVASLGLVLFGFVGLAQAQTITILHSFTGNPFGDGYNPGGVISDSAGNIYGVTALGGNGYGIVFKIDASGNYAILRKFVPPDAEIPTGVLLIDKAGDLYGTASSGGSSSNAGAVFKLDASGNETVLYSFSGGADGATPGPLVMDSAGNLYGTTSKGGANGDGVLFKLDPSGNETVLHDFASSPSDGSSPSSLAMDAAGNIYGATSGGGTNGYGTIFKLDTSGSYTVIYSFTGGANGAGPGGLLLDTTGNLYGLAGGGAYNDGIIFKLDASGTETVLHNLAAGVDGGYPSGLLRDSAGNLYCTATHFGPGDYGTVFKLDPSGNETMLYAFSFNSNGANGMYPSGSMVIDAAGNLYGTTQEGGSAGVGTVYKIAPAITTTTTGLASSANPAAYGQSVTLTAVVQPSALAATTPTGTVTFSDGTTTLASFALTNGQATFTSSSFSVGAHSIMASYSGDSSFAASTGTLSLTVNPAQTKTTVSSSSNPAVLNGTITFTATVSVVSPGAGTPTGTVTFDDGANLLGTVPLGASGTATFSPSSLALGSHTITAAYSGDSDFSGSTSTNLSQSVEYAPAGTLCDGAAGRQILPPIDPGGTSVFKQGSTVPAKFRVCDANGVSVGTAGVVTSFYLTQVVSGTATTSVEDVVDTNNPDTAFRWDSTDQQWIFNISTKSLSAGSTYIYTIGLNDGTTINFQFGLR